MRIGIQGDGDGGAGRWISSRESGGWDMIGNYGQIYVYSGIYGSYPNQFRDGYMHFYFDFHYMQGHTLFAKMTQQNHATKTWLAWWA